jgi:hypothetical protein
MFVVCCLGGLRFACLMFVVCCLGFTLRVFDVCGLLFGGLRFARLLFGIRD